VSYGWIIDTDKVTSGEPGDRDDNGTMGPGAITPEHEAALNAGEGEKWKAYCADGDLFYTGRIVGEYGGFEPLEDFATPNASAVDIKYLHDGQWRSL